MDIVLEKMKQLGVPITRKNYLDFAYFGTPPDELDAEQEAELPPEIQRLKEEPDAATEN